MVGILIINVKVRRKRIENTTSIDKQHHGIIDDKLAQKWEIGIYKAKCKHKSPTQDNLISALKPVTCRYRTYFLYQRLCRLNFRFYTDTLFEN